MKLGNLATRSWQIWLVLAIGALALLAACTSGSSSAPASKDAPKAQEAQKAQQAQPAQQAQQTYQLKMVSGNPAGHSMNKSPMRWAQKVQERTNGRVKTTVYEGTLGAPPDFYEMVKSGSVDMVHMGIAWAGDRLPLTDVVALPFEVSDRHISSAVNYELFKAGLLKEYDDFKMLYFTPTDTGHLFLAKKKVTKLEDLKGMKIRPIPGPPTKLVDALGATNISVPTAEVYQALEKGVMDGAMTMPTNVAAVRIYEVAKYTIRMPLFSATYAMMMNKDSWTKLPTDVQSIMEQVSNEEAALYLKENDELEKAAWDTIGKQSEVYTLSPEEVEKWRKAAAPVSQEWVKAMEAKGLPAQKALDTMRSVASKAAK